MASTSVPREKKMARKVAGVFGLISWTVLICFLWSYEPSLAAKEKANEPNSIIKGNDLESIARNYVTLLVNKQFEDAAKEFDSTMKTALPVSKLKDAWNSAAAPMGQFKEQGAARQEKVMGYDVVFVTCLFEKGKFDVKLVYNKSRQISGLFFVPTRD
jgi:hypothetical protein